jgi:NAD(P)-dependent dehydrogenase (short-subunit alcohol dehydrogenase family)
MAGRVAGKIALVTGGASGIGRASALALGKEGATVVVTDIQDDAGKDCTTKIKQSGSDAIYLRHDVASEDAWKSVIA